MTPPAEFPSPPSLPRQYLTTTPDNRDVDPDAWRGEALCAQTIDADRWFPDKGGNPRDAKRLCAKCPVQAQCLEYAIRTDQRFGIWGGLSERELRNVRNPNPIHHGTTTGYGRGCRNPAMCPRNEQGVSCTEARRAYDAAYRGTRREDGAA